MSKSMPNHILTTHKKYVFVLQIFSDFFEKLFWEGGVKVRAHVFVNLFCIPSGCQNVGSRFGWLIYDVDLFTPKNPILDPQISSFFSPSAEAVWLFKLWLSIFWTKAKTIANVMDNSDWEIMDAWYKYWVAIELDYIKRWSRSGKFWFIHPVKVLSQCCFPLQKTENIGEKSKNFPCRGQKNKSTL